MRQYTVYSHGQLQHDFNTWYISKEGSEQCHIYTKLALNVSATIASYLTKILDCYVLI